MRPQDLLSYARLIWTWLSNKISAAFVTALLIVCLFYYQLMVQAKKTSPAGNAGTAGEKDKLSQALDSLYSNMQLRPSPSAGTVPDSLPPAIRTLQKQISERDSLRLAKLRQENLARYSDENSKEIYWLFLFGALVIGYGTLEYTRYTLADQENEKEKDPQKLEELFQKYANLIASLGTPRKIKRFSNKVRFQYNLFEKSAMLTSENYELFFIVLIAIEKDRSIVRKTMEEFINELTDRLRETIYHSVQDPFLKEDMDVSALIRIPLVNKIYEYNHNCLV